MTGIVLFFVRSLVQAWKDWNGLDVIESLEDWTSVEPSRQVKLAIDAMIPWNGCLLRYLYIYFRSVRHEAENQTALLAVLLCHPTPESTNATAAVRQSNFILLNLISQIPHSKCADLGILAIFRHVIRGSSPRPIATLRSGCGPRIPLFEPQHQYTT
jgi:hypothetical protein